MSHPAKTLSMQKSPLQLRHYVLRKIFIEPIEGWESREEETYPDSDGMPLEADIALGDAKQANTFGVRLSIKSEPKDSKFPYRFEIGIEGYVEVLQARDEADRRELALVNGVSLLYGVIRETFLCLTQRFVHGPMMLPTLHFLDLKRDLKKGAGTAPKVGDSPTKHLPAPRRGSGKRMLKNKPERAS